MRETSFLAQNEKKWRKVESILDKNNPMDPDESADLFVEMSDDLSYARTHYPDSIATSYLNSLAVGVFQKLSPRRREKFTRFANFWKFEVPMAVARNHKTMLFTFVFFVMVVLIGAVSTHYDETFPRVVLGDEYVDMTIENIENGDPMGVYGDSDEHSMFLRITLNNIKVAAYTFVAGIFFSIGSLYYLFINGVMVGSFQYFFAQHGVLMDSLLSIWIHGTIEISCIIVAGTAGVVLGNSFLFPGTYLRKHSLVKGAKEALTIYIGIVPLIIFAAFLEGFVTRHTDSPTILRAGIILASLTFVIWYFVYYPIKLKKRVNIEN